MAEPRTLDCSRTRAAGWSLPATAGSAPGSVLVWCKSCRHRRDADLQALIDAGRGSTMRCEYTAPSPPFVLVQAVVENDIDPRFATAQMRKLVH